MPKYPVLNSKQVILLLKKAGFVEHHQKGSHKVFYHPAKKKRVVVPFHTRDLPRGTLHTILDQAEIFGENQ